MNSSNNYYLFDVNDINQEWKSQIVRTFINFIQKFLY